MKIQVSLEKSRALAMLGPQSFMATASWGCTVAAPSKSRSSVPATAWFDGCVPFSHLSCLPCACRHPCASPVGLTKLFQKFGSLGFALPHLFLRRNIGLHNDCGFVDFPQALVYKFHSHVTRGAEVIISCWCKESFFNQKSSLSFSFLPFVVLFIIIFLIYFFIPVFRALIL